MTSQSIRYSLTLFVVGVLSAAINGPTRGQDEPPAANGAVEVLTRGPVHEAFAEPVQAEQGQKTLIVPKQPPQTIEELPPEEKPAGDNVQWIGGYWAWDDELKDFLWVSGIWRQIPPGRQWVPGYWNPVAQGFQWTPGFWTSARHEEITYLPQPPAPVQEAVPPQVGGDEFWVPGVYMYADDHYRWRAGYWHHVEPGWIWVPAHYQWTPGGYVFIEGYWDYPVATRGCIFAPVYYREPIYLERRYVYSPTIAIDTNLLTVHLFARPHYCHYYFGDYYAASYLDVGIYPWFRVHSYTTVGYDPLYTYYRWENRHNSNWSLTISNNYAYLQLHSEHRPPHTLVQQNTYVKNNTNIINNTTINNTTVNNITVNKTALAQNNVLAAPIKQVATSGNTPMPFERLHHDDRVALQQNAATATQFSQNRAKAEGAGHHATGIAGGTNVASPTGTTGGSATQPIAPLKLAKTETPKISPQIIPPTDVTHKQGGSDRPPKNLPATTSTKPPATPDSLRNSTVTGKNTPALPDSSKLATPPNLGRAAGTVDQGKTSSSNTPKLDVPPKTQQPRVDISKPQNPFDPSKSQQKLDGAPKTDLTPKPQPNIDTAPKITPQPQPQVQPQPKIDTAPKITPQPQPKIDTTPKFTPPQPKIDTTPKFTPPQPKVDTAPKFTPPTPKVTPQPQPQPKSQPMPNPGGGQPGGKQPSGKDKDKRPM